MKQLMRWLRWPTRDANRTKSLPPHKLAALSAVYEIDLPRAAPPRALQLKLAVVDLDLPGSVHFAEHVRNGHGEATGSIVLLGAHRIYGSNDLGRSWTSIDTGKILPARPQKAFTTASGIHLIQGAGWTRSSDNDTPRQQLAPIARFDRHWRFLSLAYAGDVEWHGTASIGEANGTIMFAEYPDNFEAYREANPAALLKPSHVWRSRDDGASWERVFTMADGKIRHFHTCVPDPARPRRWWLSSGDRTHECFVWCSDNDGDSWVDVTNANPGVVLPAAANRKRSIHRLTDMHFDDGHLVWGTDDALGDLEKSSATGAERPGARVYRAKLVDGMLQPEELGWVGLPVRSMIDIGPAWILLTEAKRPRYSLRPQVCLLFKDEPHVVHHLFDIENFRGEPTGFTYSVASRKARNGVFFTNRGASDAFPSGIGALRWEVAFR